MRAGWNPPSVEKEVAREEWRASQLERRVTTVEASAIYAIELFEIDEIVAVKEGRFFWPIPEDLDGSSLLKAEMSVHVAGTDIELQLFNETTSGDMLSTVLKIDSGDLDSADSATPHVVDPTNAEVAWKNHIRVDIDTAGGGALGLVLTTYWAPAETASVLFTGQKGDPGADGAPGGIVNWTGEWDSGTTYAANDAVSHNGSSYVAINSSTNVEPGVDAGWETDWMLLSAAASVGPEIAAAEVTSSVTVNVTTEGSPVDVVSLGAVTYDGSAVVIEFYCPAAFASGGWGVLCELWDDTTYLCRLTDNRQNSSTDNSPIYGRIRLVPSAGSHTYKVRAFKTGGSPDVTLGAGSGSGGSGDYAPIQLSARRA